MPRSVLRIFEGRPVTVEYRSDLRDTAGHPAYAATSVPDRLIALDPELKRKPREHRRILLHEYLHFAWVRLGNRRRKEWSDWLAAEWQSGARGEAGWSAEWRKRELSAADVAQRTRKWRDYCCESFCDTGAWVIGNVDTEVTLAPSRQRARMAWFRERYGARPFPI